MGYSMAVSPLGVCSRCFLKSEKEEVLSFFYLAILGSLTQAKLYSVEKQTYCSCSYYYSGNKQLGSDAYLL